MNLNTLNSRQDLDFMNAFNRDHVDEDQNDSPYFGVNVNSRYFDLPSMDSLLKISNSPIFLSLNVQSLQSKYEDLKTAVLELINKKIQIDAIALQETWDVKYPELLPITGFKPVIIKKRRGMRGGGVGFYVRNNIDVKVIENLSPFENKILESLTIQLTYPDNRCFLLTNIYRSNGIIHNVTPAQQLERFLEKLDELLNGIRLSRKESFIFLDANIDLLNFNNGDSSNYMNTMRNHGFLQCICKATRIQNQSKSLIDHIMISSNTAEIVSGTVICDISDHFFTFVCIPGTEKSKKTTQYHYFLRFLVT